MLHNMPNTWVNVIFKMACSGVISSPLHVRIVSGSTTDSGAAASAAASAAAGTGAAASAAAGTGAAASAAAGAALDTVITISCCARDIFNINASSILPPVQSSPEN